MFFQSHLTPNSICFYADWDIVDFLEQQYHNCNIQIGSVPTISGSASCAHAATCAKYIQYFIHMRRLSSRREAMLAYIIWQAVIAHEFPVPERRGEVSLEIPPGKLLFYRLDRTIEVEEDVLSRRACDYVAVDPFRSRRNSSLSKMRLNSHNY
jgi:hypothetical protein